MPGQLDDGTFALYQRQHNTAQWRPAGWVYHHDGTSVNPGVFEVWVLRRYNYINGTGYRYPTQTGVELDLWFVPVDSTLYEYPDDFIVAMKQNLIGANEDPANYDLWVHDPIVSQAWP
jgi:hypothetical protein